MTDTTAPDAMAPAPDFPLDWSDPERCRSDVAPRRHAYAVLHGAAVVGLRANSSPAGSSTAMSGSNCRSRCGRRCSTAISTSRGSRSSRRPKRRRSTSSTSRPNAEHTPFAKAYWERAVPELRELYAGIAGVAVDELPADRAGRSMGGRLAASPARLVHPLLRDHRAVPGHGRPGRPLRIGRRERTARRGDAADPGDDRRAGRGRLWTGPADRAGSGFARAGRGQSRRSPSPSIEELAALPGGSEFVSELRAFLEEHGHLGQGFDDLGLASWAEQPAMLVSEIAKRLEHPVEPAADRAARLAGEADVLADAFRARLADQPEKLAEFERLLGAGSRDRSASPRPTTTGSTGWPRRACGRSRCGSGRGSRAKA